MSKIPNSKTTIIALNPRPVSSGQQEAHALDDQIVADTADYIAKMCSELSMLAKSTRLELLAYFLDMAKVEATIHVRNADMKQKLYDD